MKVKLPKGRYVVAVSGGVDSMVLLDILKSLPGIQLFVAHFNHGIRADSGLDEKLVKKTAEKYGLPFEAGHGKLGPGASEEKAREARYKFLKKIQQEHKARTIVTAHHQDDLLETAILNILRGTGRRGLSAIAENPDIERPMLYLSKKDILSYAKAHKLEWHEDPTNKDERYLRNYIRIRIVPRLSQSQRQHFLSSLKETAALNSTINQEIANMSQKIIDKNSLNRRKFIDLPTEIANEILMHFLRQNGIRQFNKPTVERLMVAIKTAKAGTRHDVIRGSMLEVTPTEALLRRNRGIGLRK